MISEKEVTAWIILLIVAALVIYTIIEGRNNRERKRSARVLENIELRLDKIEATMRALPQLLLEAYNQLEKRRGPQDRD